MKKVRDLLQKYKTDADIYEQLTKLKDQAIETERPTSRRRAWKPKP